MDKFSDEAQTLQQLTQESRVGNFVSQLTTRYQTLLTQAKVRQSRQGGQLFPNLYRPHNAVKML